MAKIRLADLRLSLAPGEKKRISEGNGLTLILTGSEKGTSYKFQHRCTYAGKRREKILKTQELADARRISLERMELVEKGLDPDAEPEKELTVSDAVAEYQKTLITRDLSHNTIDYRTRYSSRIDNFFGEREVKALTEQEIHSFIVSQKEQHGICSAKMTLETLSLILRAAHIIHAVPVPNLSGMQSLFQAPSVVHRAALTEGDISDNILKIFLSFDAQKHRDFLLLAFMLLFTLMPNTRVKWRNTILPSIITGTVFMAVEWLYVHYQIKLSAYNAIYGSFAAIPLFMLWLQISWCICLFGAQFCYANQSLQTYAFERISNELSRRYRDTLILLLMSRICKHFASGLKPFTAHRLATDTHLPDSLVDILLGELTDMQLLVEIHNEHGEELRYLPAIDIHRITVGMVTRRIDSHGIENPSFVWQTSMPEWDALRSLRNKNEDALLVDL